MLGPGPTSPASIPADESSKSIDWRALVERSDFRSGIVLSGSEMSIGTGVASSVTVKEARHRHAPSAGFGQSAATSVSISRTSPESSPPPLFSIASIRAAVAGKETSRHLSFSESVRSVSSNPSRTRPYSQPPVSHAHGSRGAGDGSLGHSRYLRHTVSVGVAPAVQPDSSGRDLFLANQAATSMH